MCSGSAFSTCSNMCYSFDGYLIVCFLFNCFDNKQTNVARNVEKHEKKHNLKIKKEIIVYASTVIEQAIFLLASIVLIT